MVSDFHFGMVKNKILAANKIILILLLVGVIFIIQFINRFFNLKFPFICNVKVI